MVVPAKPFDGWGLVPPIPPHELRVLFEDPTRSMIWSWPTLASSEPAVGRDRFGGTLAERNRCWREFRNYVRQARTYDEAAASVTDRSRALLQYYCLLNLAKAELLHRNPETILGRQVRHGLIAKRGKGDSISGDYLEVQPGVFQMLYAKRVGRAIPRGTRIPIARVIRQIPEVGLELTQAGLGRSVTSPIMNSVRHARGVQWAVFALHSSENVIACRVTRQRLLSRYDELDRWGEWRDYFAVSRREHTIGWKFFQSKWTIANPDLSLSPKRVFQDFQPYFSAVHHPPFDGYISPSLYLTKDLPMPASLARYALVFYLSSLVRYFPAKLDPSSQSAQSWFFDRFVQESDVPMMADATDNLAGLHTSYRGTHAFRL